MIIKDTGNKQKGAIQLGQRSQVIAPLVYFLNNHPAKRTIKAHKHRETKSELRCQFITQLVKLTTINRIILSQGNLVGSERPISNPTRLPLML